MGINYENGISNRGNQARIKSFMKRAMQGEKLTLGFLGGSITQGSLATDPKLCYAWRVYEWFGKTFPKAEFTYVNAGIGGTTSQFGVARADSDLLSAEPDFVIIEFSVNDESDEHFLETYEGLVRKVYSSQKKPAVFIVHNVYYSNGANAQIQHAKVVRHYDLPAVSMQSSIYPEVVAGRIANRDITPDDLHPNDKGHGLVAEVITYALGKIKDGLDAADKMADVGVNGGSAAADEKEPPYPAPLSANGYEHSVRYQNSDIEPESHGFVKDTSPQSDITDCFKNGWYADKTDDSILFYIKGRGISIQYKKCVTHPAPVVKVVVDGDEEQAKLLDANFDEEWGDKLVIDTITEHTDDKEHTVELTVVEAKENTVPFYLVSVIAAE